MTIREKIDLMTKINVANEQRIAEYLINGHKITPDSPGTLDLASVMVEQIRHGKLPSQEGYETLRYWAEAEGYDPNIIENAVRSVGGQR